MSKIPKEAICIRNTSTWAHVKPNHKFDSAKFNREEILQDLPLMSPKIHAMLNKIKELDAEDMSNDGKYYKHIIYSDVTGVNGAKMVASSLIANEYQLVYNKGKFVNNLPQSNYTFGLLTTSTVYQKPLTVGLKKNMMAKMNERPENVNGYNMRFIILDSGFKEGIDVFDVKYMHILEPLTTKAENTQVIGRGTRYCGQSGLPFKPNVGWSLNVYRYNINYNEDMTLHDLYIKHSNQNVNALNFTADIEDIMIAAAVDLPLTENIHMLSTKNNRFYDDIMKLIQDKENKKSKPVKKDLIKIVSNIHGKIYTNEKKIDCKFKCKGPFEELEEANSILLAAVIYDIDKLEDRYRKEKGKIILGKKILDNKITDGKLLNSLLEKYPKPILCNYLDKRMSYCDAVNKIWLRPLFMFKIFGDKIIENLKYYKRKGLINEKNYQETLMFAEKYKAMSNIKKPQILPIPPMEKMKYLDLHNYISLHFKDFKSSSLQIKNKCVSEPETDSKKKEYEIVKFSNTQSFVQNFLTPESPYKGLFLYHSVGSGKTCTAIASATKSFDENDYTILWVTRHTLKEDIWKNMFEKICNIKIREMLQNGKILPKTKAERMALLGKNWLQPISYKQFTNLIKGKNKFYQQMVARNGKEDPFKKTLIIIDEIHKVYSDTLSRLEKPNPEVLQDMVQKSYSVSKKDSLKLLLMSATPITEDPMSAVKILNLLLEGDDRFPEDFEEFKSLYCNDNGLFSNLGSFSFIDKVSGLISYIDRSNDRSQFAYPVMNDIILNINTEVATNQRMVEIEQRLEVLEENKLNTDKQFNKQQIKEFTKEISELNKEKKQLYKQDTEPKSVLDFVNKCFSKTKTKDLKKV
jgi:superfamily II DNA or RNA helicase